MTKRLPIVTQESFIARSNIVHNSKYDYSLSKYTGYREKLDIICPIHGKFQRSPADHLSAKRGCPVCSPTRRKTTSEFIENATKIHGDRYDYSLVEYTNSSTKVNIICKKHGPFYCSPTNHVHDKNGCPLCSIRYVPTTEGFISSASKIHNNEYNYDKVIYSSSKTPVIIGCSLHGEFMQTPNNHIEGMGCKKCSVIATGKKLKQPINEFITRANIIYNNKYNYSLVDYDNYHSPITIICPIHNEFQRTPETHIYNLLGCYKCEPTRTIESKWLDTLNIPEDRRQIRIFIDKKIYIPDAYIAETNTVYEFWGDYWHGNPNKYCPNDINPNNKTTYGDLYNETQQKRQALLDAGYNLIEIWETDYINTILRNKIIDILKEITMKMSPENKIRLTQLLADGVQVLQECEDLKTGLSETTKAIAEELDIKAALLNKFIREQHKNKTNDNREDNEILEELRKTIGLG